MTDGQDVVGGRPPTARRGRWPRRGWVRGLTILIAAVAIGVACLPALCNWPPVRTWILGRVTGKVRGELTAKSLRVGWGVPLQIDALRLTAPDGSPVVTVDRCTGDRSLGQLLWAPTSLGKYRFDSPTLHVHLRPGGSNIADAFSRRITTSPNPLSHNVAKAVARNISVSAELASARLEFRARPESEPWILGDLNLRMGLHRPSWQDSRSYAVLEPGVLLDHVRVTPESTRDLLQFIAPILSQATSSEGTFSLATKGAVFPLDALADGYCDGTLEIHDLRAGPGPLVTELANLLRLPASIELVDESRVQYRLRERLIRHEGLRFRLGRTEFSTVGEVGLDESIRLVVELTIPEEAGPQGPVLPERIARLVRGKSLKIPFHGSLRKPRIDWETWMRQAATNRPLIQELLQENPEMMQQAWKAIGKIQQLREQWQTEQSEPSTQDRPKRPLRRLRDFLRESLPKPPEEAPPAEESPPEESADE